jgi:hypothetical protein
MRSHLQAADTAAASGAAFTIHRPARHLPVRTHSIITSCIQQGLGSHHSSPTQPLCHPHPHTTAVTWVTPKSLWNISDRSNNSVAVSTQDNPDRNVHPDGAPVDQAVSESRNGSARLTGLPDPEALAALGLPSPRLSRLRVGSRARPGDSQRVHAEGTAPRAGFCPTREVGVPPGPDPAPASTRQAGSPPRPGVW